jgi:hypothetical protein
MVTPIRAPAAPDDAPADPELEAVASAVLVLEPQALKPTARHRPTARVAPLANFILLFSPL